MDKHEVEKVEREVKQIGLDIVIGLVILVFIGGYFIGAITN